jgi:hypothetical protein
MLVVCTTLLDAEFPESVTKDMRYAMTGREKTGFFGEKIE